MIDKNSSIMRIAVSPLSPFTAWGTVVLLSAVRDDEARQRIGKCKKHLTVQTGYAKISATSAPEKKMCA